MTHASSADRKRRTSFYRHSHREVFQNPLPTPSKIAILSSRFHERNGVRCFSPTALSDLQDFAPDIVAGPLQSLLSLSKSIKVARALVVFSAPLEAAITAEDRDRLWNEFGVPVFEQRLDSEGQVTARECEAHQGLHVVSGANHRRSESFLEEPCECGSSEPRIAAVPA